MYKNVSIHFHCLFCYLKAGSHTAIVCPIYLQRKYMVMQQIILIYPVFSQFNLFVFLWKNHSVTTGLKPFSYKSKFSSIRDGPLEKLWGGGEFSGRRNFFSLSNSLYEFFLGRCMNIFRVNWRA